MMHNSSNVEHSIFTKVTLSTEDELQGRILSPLQQQVLRNMLAGFAEEKVFMKYTPDNPQEYIQMEAELQGQIHLLNSLLLQSEEATLELLNQNS